MLLGSMHNSLLCGLNPLCSCSCKVFQSRGQRGPVVLQQVWQLSHCRERALVFAPPWFVAGILTARIVKEEWPIVLTDRCLPSSKSKQWSFSKGRLRSLWTSHETFLYYGLVHFEGYQWFEPKRMWLSAWTWQGDLSMAGPMQDCCESIAYKHTCPKDHEKDLQQRNSVHKQWLFDCIVQIHALSYLQCSSNLTVSGQLGNIEPRYDGAVDPSDKSRFCPAQCYDLWLDGFTLLEVESWKDWVGGWVGWLVAISFLNHRISTHLVLFWCAKRSRSYLIGLFGPSLSASHSHAYVYVYIICIYTHSHDCI